jgi:hypothetical protein
MPADVELARREGIELVKTGSWGALTGTWNPTPEDLAAAVEAQDCPAIRKPILKLGHQDPRFDGEPALGWFEHLRLADDGHTLLADQVALPWLHSVQAAAYPSRSVEGNYNHACGAGHRHKFVLTAVALLGVTPPAVKTIRNLNDLPAMLGVAAGEPEVPDGAKHVQVTILAGRHSWDEGKHQRDGDGKFASAPGGEGSSSPAPSGLKQDPKLAARIPLGDGETYAGSASIRSAGIALAAVDGPDGRTVRLGVGIDPDEISRWSGANRGGTVVLDQQGMDQLREAIPQMLEAGKAGKARWRQMDRELDRLETAGDQAALDAHNEQMSAFGDFSVLDEGTITGRWGDLRIRVLMSDGEPRYYLDADTGTTPPTVAGELIEASHLRRLAKLLEQAGAATPVQASTVHAAAEVHTGAMVALIPTTVDAARLAVEGGEPADQLHVTLAYLGEAADLGPAGQQDVIDAVSTAVNGLPHIDADVFSVNVFNPPGMTSDDGRDRDTCLVWGLSGDLIDIVHTLISEALWAVPTPDQHRPWHCHMTAAYTDDLGRIPELAAKVGPVRFDRVRLAFAGQHVDIPLIGDDPSEVAASDRFAARLTDLRDRRAAQVAAASPPEHPAPELPAAEPEQENHPDPKEDPVSTDLSALRSRLGLDDTADLDAITAAVDELKTKADTPTPTPPPVDPNPELVKASAEAAERTAELEKTVEKLGEQLGAISAELAAAKQEKADTVKASVLGEAKRLGKFTPADEQRWSDDYDEAPAVTTRILASIAPGTAVPVQAAGVTGPAEPTVNDDGLGVSESSLADWAKQLGFDPKELNV